MKQISVQDLSGWLAQAAPPVVLDVREPWEVALAQVPGSVAIPMHDIPARLAQLPTHQATVCLCHHAIRSRLVAFSSFYVIGRSVSQRPG